MHLVMLVVRSCLLPPAHPTPPAFGGAHASGLVVIPTAAHVPMEPFRYHVAQLTTRPPAMVDRCWPSAVEM
ncbi:hypothetical protein K439DRAFT_1633181 [Ramaria rubella]|nr:hypothetical protein K439DRAFT_1633181 [Ramaria rubella]